MKVVYIAGPYRSDTAWGIENNIRRAEEWGFRVASLGGSPLIPHSNTRFFHGTLSDAFWLEATMALLRKADGVVMMPGWISSSGATAERGEAMRLGIRVFEVDPLTGRLPRELGEWLEDSYR